MSVLHHFTRRVITRTFHWSDEIKPDSESHPPYYRCFDETCKLVGYVRVQEHKTKPMFRAIICTGRSSKNEYFLAYYETLESAKAAVERELC